MFSNLDFLMKSGFPKTRDLSPAAPRGVYISRNYPQSKTKRKWPTIKKRHLSVKWLPFLCRGNRSAGCGGTARPGYLNAYLIKKVRTPSGKPGWGNGVPMASMENPRMSEIMDFNENHNSVRQKIGDPGSKSIRNIFPLHPVTPKRPESPYGAKHVFGAENPVFQFFGL